MACACGFGCVQNTSRAQSSRPAVRPRARSAITIRSVAGITLITIPGARGDSIKGLWNVYYFTTVIRQNGTTRSYSFTVGHWYREGVVSFDFSENTHFSPGNRHNSALALAMMDAAKSVNPQFQGGRTVRGIVAELDGHYVAFRRGFTQGIRNQGEVSNMGGLFRWRPDFDSNAWFWELVGG